MVIFLAAFLLVQGKPEDIYSNLLQKHLSALKKHSYGHEERSQTSCHCVSC